MSSFTWAGWEEVEALVRQHIAELGYLTIYDRTDRAAGEDQLGRWDLPTSGAGDDGAETALDYIRQTLEGCTYGFGRRVYRVRLHGPKGLRTLGTRNVTVVSGAGDPEATGDEDGEETDWAPPAADPPAEDDVEAKLYRLLRPSIAALGDQYQQFGRMVLAALARVNAVADAQHKVMVTQNVELMANQEKLLAALITERTETARVAAETEEAKQRVELMKEGVAALRELGGAVIGEASGGAALGELGDLLKLVRGNDRLMSALKNEDLKDLLSRPEQAAQFAALLEDVARRARAAKAAAAAPEKPAGDAGQPPSEA